MIGKKEQLWECVWFVDGSLRTKTFKTLTGAKKFYEKHQADKEKYCWQVREKTKKERYV